MNKGQWAIARRKTRQSIRAFENLGTRAVCTVPLHPTNTNLSNPSELGPRAIICPMTPDLGRANCFVTPDDGIYLRRRSKTAQKLVVFAE